MPATRSPLRAPRRGRTVRSMPLTPTRLPGTGTMEQALSDWRWDATNAFNGCDEHPPLLRIPAMASSGTEPHLYPTIAHDVPPAPPGGIVASGGDGTVTLSWNSSFRSKARRVRGSSERVRRNWPPGILAPTWARLLVRQCVCGPNGRQRNDLRMTPFPLLTSDSTPEYSSFAVSAAVTPSHVFPRHAALRAKRRALALAVSGARHHQVSHGSPPSTPSGIRAVGLGHYFISAVPTV